MVNIRVEIVYANRIDLCVHKQGDAIVDLNTYAEFLHQRGIPKASRRVAERVAARVKARGATRLIAGQ